MAVSTPEHISALATRLHTEISSIVSEIDNINSQVKLLALNALIEAARAGQTGVSFAVVAREMGDLAESTKRTTQKISTKTGALAGELVQISKELATSVRGTRLADLAHTNIELIDRNLYERSCDCRWWATDAAVVKVLEDKTPPNQSYAHERLSVILNAYTVYFDIVVADLAGTVVVNGRSDLGQSIGTNHSTSTWFTSALHTASGNEFGFESVHKSSLVCGERVLIYSCKVCKGGNANAEPIGVLGVIFKWDSLAQTIVASTPIEEAERSRTVVCILDERAHILAISPERTSLVIDNRTILAPDKNSLETRIGGKNALVAHARSPGYETYKTGWHSVIATFH
jgi:hypothetical protein